MDIEGGVFAFSEKDFPGKYHIIASVEDAPEGLIHQVSIHTESPQEASAVVERINRKYGSYAAAFRNVTEVDIAPKGCSKGRGLEILRDSLCRRYGECRLYGIGDSMNDLPLIEAADVSYTFPYAPKELRGKAAKVVETIREALADSF